ncbi:DUF3307 domain-containing protein [Spongiivirga sp. MCCC 1A20706]|uniref:DUF3307 domain-containing protein n=1 Tax=Spongiivirga sp. MCCC 1A20706 TaxID=3160963 RepID=UPI0039774E46
MNILLQLLLAHVITDFALQSQKLIDHKKKYRARSWFLWVHALLAGVLSVLFLMDIKYWYVGLIISITHFFIDLWKLHKNNDNLKYFLLDQLFHILIIIVSWLLVINGFKEVLPLFKTVLQSNQIVGIILGYILVIFPVGFIIGRATQRWRKEVEVAGEEASLEKAGRYIGIFERILVFTFVVTNQMAAIGFLIAAKSILRFSNKEEVNARKQTEYVLIGTLMSFSISIVIGILVRVVSF